MRAELALDQGKLERAVSEARGAADEAAAANRRFDEADARELLARALFAAGKKSEATAAIERALALTNGSELRDQRWRVETAAARIAGDCAAARRAPPLASVVDAASRSHAVDRKLEALYARGEILRACGDKSAAATLAAVAAEARRDGFNRIARLAGH